jgi:hypothetical protein
VRDASQAQLALPHPDVPISDPPADVTEKHKPPKSASAVTQLREAFESWYSERYPGDEYYWTGKDGGIAADLIRRAGERGISEILRRADVLGAQKRDKHVTLGLIQLTWNELPSKSSPAPTAIAPSPRDPLNPEPLPPPGTFDRPGLEKPPVNLETLEKYFAARAVAGGEAT